MKPAIRPLFALAALAAALAYVPVGAAPPKNQTWYPVVPLSVTVEPTMSDLSTAAITPDGLGSYVDGQDGVSANLDKYGNLIVDFGLRTGLRTLNYDYDPDLSYEGSGSWLSTVGTVFQDIVSGPVCVQAAITRSGAEYQLWHYFGRNVSTYDNATTTSWLVVTRDAEDDSWTVETDTSDGYGCDGVGGSRTRVLQPSTRGKSTLTDLGLFSLPFHMTLQALSPQ